MPLYWVLGRRKFKGYEEAYQAVIRQCQAQANEAQQQILAHVADPPEAIASLGPLAKTLNGIPFIGGNRTRLLIDGDRTYNVLIEAIQTAQSYILFQFYTINDDAAGRRCLQALAEKAQQGVSVYMLYDKIGSSQMTSAFLEACKSQGIHIAAFRSALGKNNRFQLKSKVLQISFFKDWYWANRAFPSVTWESEPVGAETVLILPTGPADRHQSCTLFVDSAIALTQRRVWIASPYFVPDEPTLAALKVAVLRGVDVRIILPENPDHLIVYLCSFAYYTELQNTGIKLYRYRTGFMHQKVILVDDELAGVGTVNLDNRSFLLNFEIMAYVSRGEFVHQVEAMLKRDLAESNLVDYSEYAKRSWPAKLAIQSARLVGPLQ